MCPGIHKRDLTIIAGNAWPALWWSFVLLRTGNRIGADFIHNVVRSSLMDRFPASECRGVVTLCLSLFWFRAILVGGCVVCVDS